MAFNPFFTCFSMAVVAEGGPVEGRWAHAAGTRSSAPLVCWLVTVREGGGLGVLSRNNRMWFGVPFLFYWLKESTFFFFKKKKS